MSKIISGGNLPNIPWQDKPADYWPPIWRYDANPVIFNFFLLNLKFILTNFT